MVKSPVSAEVADMVRLLFDERTNALGVPGVPSRFRSWVTARTGVHEATLRAWERGRYVPTLRSFVPWCGVLGFRLVLTDHRDLRWSWGFEPFDERHWGVAARVEWFTEIEILRLRYTLKTARVVSGMEMWQITTQIGCGNVVGRWESGRYSPQLDNFVRWAGALGLCASIERADELSPETPDYDPVALRPDGEVGVR